MSDNDLIWRGDALAAVQEWTYCCDAEEAIAALPAVAPAPDAAAIREATARLHKLAYWLDTDAEVLAEMDDRDLSDHQHIQAEVNAILALLPKGGA